MATTTRQLADFIVEGGVQDIAVQQNPHIQPGTLQPAIAGKLLDGTTSHSGAYGTAQSDGHSYYYTDIKGSKPIKDPRIGAHFGSQRHKCRSIQLLEQESASHGKNVYCVDGRDWCKVGGGTKQGINLLNSSWRMENVSDGYGLRVQTTEATNFIEVIGFFNGASILVDYHSGHVLEMDTMIDGVNNQSLIHI